MGLELPKTLDVFEPEGDVKPLGIIHFVHGMAEHKLRYKDTIDFFLKNGYICAISDLRGHGENIESDDDLGYFGPNGDNAFVEDIHNITIYLKERFEGYPYYLLGHSMGSLIARAYTKKYDAELDGLIISGSPSKAAGIGAGKFLIKLLTKIHGEHYRSDFINNLVFGAFNKNFKHEGIDFAWLSTDRQISEKYIADKKCGFVFTLNGFNSLMKLIESVYTKKGWELNNPYLPMLFLSGEKDPCRINDKKFYEAVNTMRNVGYMSISFRIFSGMRHEILNEKDKKEVYKDILEWVSEI